MSVDVNELLTMAVQIGASDLLIKAGAQPITRINGALNIVQDRPKLSSEDTQQMAFDVLTSKQKEIFLRKNEIDVSYSIPGVGRFRCNCFSQRGAVSVVFRVVPMTPFMLDDLNLPSVIKKIALEPRGLVLVTGTTGSGKTTTLSAMVDFINSNKTEHIITIEDPIEYLHRDRMSVINQREIGADTESFSKALRSALRQDPDVILVGEMRDFETVQTAIIAAETGHLVMSTLHTLDATETINRIISVFPPYQSQQIRLQLAAVIKAVISMRLMPRVDVEGRVPAVEILVATERIKACIEDPEQTKLIPDAIAAGHSQYGMQTFDQSLMQLYRDGMISYEEALSRASKPDDFALRVKGVSGTSEIWDEGKEFLDGTGPEIERFSK
jgi:twitching motility protein PilT